MKEKDAIYLVDDEQELLELFNLHFSETNQNLVTFSNGKGYCQAITNSTPHAVVTDIYMEEENGFDIINKTRELHPTVPIFVVTGYPDFCKTEEFKRLNITKVYFKPFDIDSFAIDLKKEIEQFYCSVD